jgi:hypothetical protein
LSRRRSLTVPLSLVALLVPAAAHAATFCAGGPKGCAGTPTATVQSALDLAAAAPGRDRVEVGLNTQSEQGFTVAAGNDVDVVGVDSPGLFADSAHAIVVDEESATLQGVWIAAGGSGAPAPVQLRRGTFVDVNIGNFTAGTALRLVDGTLRDVLVSGALELGTVAVRADGGTATIEDSYLSAGRALVADAADLTLTRVRAIGLGGEPGAAGVVVTGGRLVADDSLFELLDGDATGAAVDVRAVGAATAVWLRSTSVLPGWSGDQQAAPGVRATCSGGGTADVRLLDTVVSDYGPDLARSGANCTMQLDHVRYGTRDGGGGSFVDGPGVSSGPLPAWYDDGPAFGSPLVDAGSARPAAPGETDLHGQPRVVDGGVAGAVRDIGAVEYQHRPPTIALSGPATGRAGEALTFVADGDEPDGDTFTFAWTVDGAEALPPERDEPRHVRATFATAGRHTVGVTIRDASGQTAHAERDVEVVPAAPPAPAITAPVPPIRPGLVGTPGPRVPDAGIDSILMDDRLGRGPLRIALECRRRTPCAGVVSVRAMAHGHRIAVGRRAFAARGRATITIKVPVSTAARRAARRYGGLTLTVAILHTSGTRWTDGQGGRIKP